MYGFFTGQYPSRQRDIIDRKALADVGLTSLCGWRKSRKRAERRASSNCSCAWPTVGRRSSGACCENPSQGYRAATEQAFLIDQLVRLIYDHVTTPCLSRIGNRSASERIAILAVGGYGRGEKWHRIAMSISPSSRLTKRSAGPNRLSRHIVPALGSGSESRPVQPLARRNREDGAGGSDHPHRTARKPLRLG